MKNILKNESAIFLAILSLAILFPLEHILLHNTLFNVIAFVATFLVIIYAALNVAQHAESLAEKYGEPYGTMILTLSAVTVEVIMIAILMQHTPNINLARDTIVSAILLDINGLLGVAAIIGGIKHGEQDFNFDSSNSYTSMIIVAIGISMIMPIFIPSTYMNAYLIFLVVIFIFMFIIFTRIQVKEHYYFFRYDYNKRNKQKKFIADTEHTPKNINGIYEAFFLLISLISIGLLSELLSSFMNVGLTHFSMPIAISALVVAIVSASPELITALKSAIENKMQTVINIALGASLSTVLLTIPAVIILSFITGHGLNLSLSNTQIILLTLTFLVCIIHYYDGQSNMLEGAIHFILFLVFIFILVIDQF